MKELSSRQETIKQLLLYFHDEKRRIERRISTLRGECKELGHVIAPRDSNIMERLKTDRWASTGAYCLVCGQTFGWWCPESPDHVCHYSKSEDDCDYCHMPMERK